MNPPLPPSTGSVPTLRVAVELTFVRSCEECRRVAERTAIAAIQDASVSAFRAVPGSKHAHASSSAEQPATPGAGLEATPLFTSTPQSDTNGFDTFM